MRKISVLFSLFLLLTLLLGACGPKEESAPQPPQPEQPAATEPPAEEPTGDEQGEPEAAPAESAEGVEHTNVPGAFPEYTGLHMFDHNTIDGMGKLRSVLGDRFSNGQLERPYNTADVHFPYLDIREGTFYETDPTWMYVVVGMVGTDDNGNLPARYGLEFDVDLTGKGTWLILIDNLSSTEWTTDGVQVWTDANGDVGGAKPMFTESGAESGDGYETLVFDQGSGDDPDLAWVRMNSEDPASFDIAFKKSMLGTEKFLISIWAGTSQLEPAKFDHNDRMTPEQAGAMDPETYPDLVPIKELSELDNTCRFEIGFNAPTVKGACPPQ
jgi:hypothetical protein